MSSYAPWCCILTLFLSVNVLAGDWLRGGREAPETRDATLRFAVGAVSDIQGLVQETQRTFYDVSGQPEKQQLAEYYDLDDFGMDDSYPAAGFGFDWIWRYVSLEWNVLFMNPDVSTVAQRNYYIGVGDDITFEGQGYDNLLIPEGQSFSMDLLGAMSEVRGMFTPVTFAPAETVRITPWIDLGLFLFGGYYEIDAGPPTGTTQYLNPPEDFVIGGASDGYVGMGLPEYGAGGEIRLGRPDALNLVIQGHYAMCDYSGSTDWIVSTAHREKNADIDHVNVRLRCTLDIPLENGRAVLVGIDYQAIDSEALLTGTAETEEDVLAQRERFDKYVSFELTALTALFGFTF
ncbi:MAG: hypothetical protein JW951_09540 [Lentisphaerae bacterium]|nr:hypothetical protein [Lentisphaerota bacterium]